MTLRIVDHALWNDKGLAQVDGKFSEPHTRPQTLQWEVARIATCCYYSRAFLLTKVTVPLQVGRVWLCEQKCCRRGGVGPHANHVRISIPTSTNYANPRMAVLRRKKISRAIGRKDTAWHGLGAGWDRTTRDLRMGMSPRTCHASSRWRKESKVRFLFGRRDLHDAQRSCLHLLT
jgi:hypothetical protein